MRRRGRELWGGGLLWGESDYGENKGTRSRDTARGRKGVREEMTVSGQDRRGGSRGERVIWIEWSRWREEEEEEEKVQGDKSAEAPRVFRDKGLACRHQRQDYQRARKTYITPRKETFCFWRNARTKRSPKRRRMMARMITALISNSNTMTRLMNIITKLLQNLIQQTHQKHDKRWLWLI